jgi:tripartite-type tricarboxylate transporter receptor subunit TctC
MKRFLILMLWAGIAAAQDYPSKPVRFVVGFAAGGPTDVIARVVAQDLSISMKQPVIVENRPGANAIIATEAVARAAPDGHTLLFSSLSLLVNAILMEGKVKYDPFRDFAPVSNAAVLPMVVVTSPQTRIGSMQDLLAAAKSKPGQVSYGTSGQGGSTHLAGAMLENLTGTKMINVPFKGNGPALAVGTTARHPDFPGVPTLAESGLPGPEATAPWVGVLAPAGTPAPVVNRLSGEMRKSLAKPETRERMRQLGAITVGDTPAEFLTFLKNDHERWARVIQAAGVKAE